MKKILLGVLMLMIVSLFTLTVTAAPTEDGSIVVNEEYIFEAYAEDAESVEIEGVSYDETTNTLTLQNANVKVVDTFYMGEDFKINVVGENNVEAFKIYDSSVEFVGTGILNLKSTEEIEDFIMVSGNKTKVGAITINMVNDPPYEYKYGIFGGESDVELNGTKINFDNMYNVVEGINVKLNNVTIKGKVAKVIVEGIQVKIKDSKIICENVTECIYTFSDEENNIKGNVEIDNSTIEVTKEIRYDLISAEGKVNVNNSKLNMVTARDSGNATGIYSEDIVTIKNSDITFVSGETAIFAHEKITLENTKLTVKDVIFGMYSFGEIAIKGGSTDIKADLLAIASLAFEEEGKISISDGMIIEPNASIKSMNEDDEYITTFATGELKMLETEDSFEIENGVKEIKIYEPIKYEEIKISDTKYTLEKDDTLTITVQSDFSKFKTVYVNGKELTKDQYTAKEGSTIITISKAYLSSLKAGTYNVKVEFTNGTAETSFKVEEEVVEKPIVQEPAVKEPVKDKTPATGSVNYIPYVTIVAVVSLAGVVVCKKAEQN